MNLVKGGQRVTFCLYSNLENKVREEIRGKAGIQKIYSKNIKKAWKGKKFFISFGQKQSENERKEADLKGFFILLFLMNKIFQKLKDLEGKS